MTLTRRDIEDVYPLSPLQQGVLFHAALDPEAGDYVVQLSAELAPGITPRTFREAWETMMRRHGVLRTLFLRDAPERPLQIVVKGGTLPWTELDWRGVDEEERRRRLTVMLAADRRRGFVLTDPPLLRIAAVRLDEMRWWILLSFHHILWDGWSLGQLLQDVSSCCEALSDGRAPDLPERRPYRDYIAWLARQDVRQAEAFWRTELAGLAAMPPIGGDRVAPVHARASYRQVKTRLSAAADRALVDFARRNSLTINTVVQGAWAIVLARHTSIEDVVFGATVSGRPADLAGVESMLGLFLNTLPVRVRVSQDAPVQEWLAALQAHQLCAREYDFCQLADIQRFASRAAGLPLFATILDVKSRLLHYHPRTADRPLFAGEVETFEQSGYPLTVTASFQPELVLDLDFNQACFDASTAARMLEHLRVLLENIPGRLRGRVGDLGLLSVAETQMIEAWSARAVQTRRTTGFAQDFEARVAAAPAAVAVITDRERISYQALNRRANQLSAYLQELGVGPEKRVGICLDRSPELVAALIATLKAGGVYVPLDPANPEERLGRCARDATIDVLIVTDGTAGTAPRTPAPIVNLNGDCDRIAQRSGENPARTTVDPLSLAYIIFTSGSTGTPKGAMVELLGMLNHLDVMIDTLSLGPSDVVAQTASIVFDISVWQMLAPLLAGAAVRIFGDDVAFDASALLRGVARDRVTVLQVVPPVLRLVMDEEAAGGGVAGTLRWLSVTGDAVPPDLASRWLERHPNVPLLNAYGPAECADDVTLGALTPRVLWDRVCAPIGRPIANAEVYVLDRAMRLSPVGVVGELYVGGQCVGRGYVSDPARTAAAFVPNPFATRPGERLYRTGDLGRWREDGSLVCLGRRDWQVKVNGARVETAEIESALLAHEQVEEAVAVCAGAVETRRLVAFVVLVGGTAAAGRDVAERVKEHLRGRLPRFMIPAVVTVLDALPLTANGKVDRDRLQRLGEALRTDRRRGAHLTPPEEAMAAIWSAVLGVEEVAADDDFFALGGHSLLMMQVVSKVSRAVGHTVPLRALFDAPRLTDFTREVEAARRDPAAGIPIERVPRSGPVSVSPAQQRMWSLMVSWPDRALYTMPVAIRLRGALDEPALAQAFTDLVTRHEALRTRVRTRDGTLVQLIDEPTPVRLPLVDLARYGSDVESLARLVATEEASRGFNPVDEHGLRAALLRLRDDEHVLLVTLNHLVGDDASMVVLLADLARAYEARSAGLPSPLSPLAVQFADHVCWLDRMMATAEGRRQEAYWRQQLATPPPRLDLPSSRPRSPRSGFRFRRVRRRVPETADRQLRELARKHGVTLFTAVLAAYKLFLSRRTGQSDIAVATMVSTRTSAELREVIGPLLTTQILRTNLPGNGRFSELLGRVQRTVIEGLANRDIPIDRAIVAAAGTRNLQDVLSVQTLILFQQLGDESWTMGDLLASPLPIEPSTGDELEISSYELICEIETRARSLDVIFRYNADLFDDDLASQMSDEFVDVLTSARSDRMTCVQSESELLRDGD
jgi:amino acid adenylation domain-containing protein